MHYGKKSRWWVQFDALGNVLLGNLYVLALMWMLLSHVQPTLNIVVDQAHLFIVMVFPSGSELLNDGLLCLSAR